MSGLISMSELFRKLKEKSVSTINAMNDNNNNSNNSDSVKYNEVFEHNLNVLIELCDQKLNNNNNTSDCVVAQNSCSTKYTKVNDYEMFTKKVNTRDGIRYECAFNNDCKNKYTRKPALLTHINAVHTGEKPYKCDRNDCHFKTAHKSCLYSHIECVHSFKKPYKCKLRNCHFETSRKSSLNVHQELCHSRIVTSGNKITLTCDWKACEFKTAHRFLLKIHKRKHTKPFECNQNKCDYKCAYERNLQRHIKKCHTIKKRM